LESIDIHEHRRLLAENPDKLDTTIHIESAATWRTEQAYEQSMYDKYQRLLDLETHECPTCGEDVNIDFIKGQMAKHLKTVEYCEEEIQKQTEKLSEVKKKNTIHETAKRGISHWEETYRSIDQNLSSDIPDAEKIKIRINELSNEYKKYQSDLREAIDHNNNVERHNTRISIIQEQETNFETELAELIENLEKVEDKLASVEILKKAFSTNGLLAYKIENLVKDLEELTNEYLAELSDGRFSLEFVVLNDKLNVIIEDNGKSVDILSLSAGELARVNTATLLAIRKLMSSISKSQINILFLDEVTNVLDELGKERLVEILLKEENLNTYIVSHGWTHPLLEKIEVIKEDEVSKLDG